MEREELEMGDVEDVIDDLYSVIEPLYVELYSFVRGRLAAVDVSVQQELPLPAHVLGPLHLHVSPYLIASVLAHLMDDKSCRICRKYPRNLWEISGKSFQTVMKSIDGIR